MNIAWDLTSLPLKTREFIRKQRDEETVKALLKANARQRWLATHFRNNPTQAREGFGGQTMVFDPVVLAGMRREANAQPGEEGEIQRHYARKYPGLYTTRHRTTRLQVGFGSTPVLRKRDVIPTRPGVKFIRVYEADPLPIEDCQLPIGNGNGDGGPHGVRQSEIGNQQSAII